MAVSPERFLMEISMSLGTPTTQLDLTHSFVQLGGSSISAIFLVSACKRRGLRLDVESVLSTASIYEVLNQAVQSPLLFSTHLNGQETRPLGTRWEDEYSLSTKSIANSITRATSSIENGAHLTPSATLAGQWYPATEIQLCLLHGSQREAGSNVITYVEVYRPEDIPLLKRAWKTVVDIEPIFRTSIQFQNGQYCLTEQHDAPFCWSELVVTNFEAYNNEVHGIAADTMAPTFYFQVITLPASRHGQARSAVKWRIHHALIDGYSSALVLEKVRMVTAGLSVRPGPSFARLAGDLHHFQKRHEWNGQKFWRQQQEHHPSAASEILFPSPQPQLNNMKYTDSVTLEVPFEKAILYAKQNHVTLASLYHAAWALTLSMYTGSDSVVFGAVLSGRNLPLEGVEETIGPLLNTLPFYVNFDRRSTALEHTRKVFSSLNELARFQWTTPEHGYIRKFSSSLAMQFSIPEVMGRPLIPLYKPFFQVISDIPLCLMLEEDGIGHLNYHTNVYNASDIKRLGMTFCDAVSALLTPQTPIGVCLDNLFHSREQLRRVGNWDSPLTTSATVDEDLITLFNRVVETFGDAVAVEKDSQGLSYAELGYKSDAIARYVSSVVRPQEIVCVHADRSINWIIAIYGVLKAGAIYCPFDQALPSRLRNQNFQQTGSRLFLTPMAAARIFQPTGCSHCTSVEELLAESSSKDSNNAVELKRDQLRHLIKDPAYVCFTSGSTGVAKGVLCSHRGLVAFQRDPEVRLFANPGRRIGQLLSPAFDGSIHEIFSALSYGATLVLSSNANPFTHLRLVDSVILTPSIAKALDPCDFPRLKTVYFVGEPVPQILNDCWALQKTVYNMYGPTESTCGATIKRLSRGTPVTIGVPNSSTRLYILDNQRRLTPLGVIGEIYLAGVQVSHGYIGMAEATAQSFFPDSICPESGEQMYKTGDRGYWNNDGEVVCLGRNDRMVKLGGFRVDLDDIEIRILGADSAVTAVAVVCTGEYLIAMIQPRQIDVLLFRSKVGKHVPSYAHPRQVLAVDHFPMSAAGKIDYTTITQIALSQGFYDTKPLITSTEKILASEWCDIVGLASHSPINGNSNFSDLGGNSIRQLMLSSRLTSVFGRQISLRLLIECSTLSELARVIDNLEPIENSISLADPVDAHMLSPIELEWWKKYHLNRHSAAFNISFVCTLEQEISCSRLTKAWNSVLARHQILRCRYVERPGGETRRIYSTYLPRVQQIDHIDVWKAINRPFDLEHNSLIRVIITRKHLAVVLSHIICDLTTLQILLNESAMLYNDCDLMPIKQTYMQAALWNRVSPPYSLQFWTEYLKDLPTKKYCIPSIGSKRLSYNGSTCVSKVNVETFHNMTRFSAEHGITLHQLLLAAVALVLQHEDQYQDVILGAPYLNRQSIEDLEAVGLFLEPLPIRVRYRRPPDITHVPADHHSLTGTLKSPDPYVSAVHESSQAALSHALPWNRLLDHLGIIPDFPENPLFDVMVTFHDERQWPSLPLAHASPLLTWTEGAKFKMMVEALVVSEQTLMLRLEYDHDCFAARDIETAKTLVIYSLDMLTRGYSYDYMVRGLRDARRIRGTDFEIPTKNYFGAQLARL